jgi:hypothetical protein
LNSIKMNRKERTGVLFALLMLFGINVAVGQGISKKRDYSGFFDSYFYRGPLSFTVGAGTSLYSGDMSKGFYGTPSVAFNLGANYKIWPRTMFGLEFNYLSLAGKGEPVAGAEGAADFTPSFTSTNWGLNVFGRLYIVDDIVRSAHDRATNKKLKVYITTGLGFIRYTAVNATYGGASAMAPVFPLGLGFEYRISGKLQIIPEFTQTFTLNDRLDGAAIKKGGDGYGILALKIQYCPWAPKKKKKITLTPPEQNPTREEHQEWRKKKEVPKPPPVEEDHNEEENNNEENNNNEETPPTDEQPTEDAPKEEEPKPDGQ